MAVTLEQAKLLTQDHLDIQIIDEFMKNNYILNNITFDDAISPTGGGGTLTYSYTRLLTQPTAGFRAINTEYTPHEVSKKRYSVDLKVFGGSFQVDRVINSLGGIANETTLQLQQKVKAAQALFNDTFINGDSDKVENSFDGIDKAVKGTSTEFNEGGTVIDLSTSANVTSNYLAFLDTIDEFLAELDGEPSLLACNTKLAAKIRACARRATMYQTSTDNFGKTIEYYGNIPFIDLGAKAGSNDSVIGTDVSEGTTSLYAIRLGLDGVHGVSLYGQSPVKTYLPNFEEPNAVKKGEVEMVAAVAVKSSKAAGVLRNIKVK